MSDRRAVLGSNPGRGRAPSYLFYYARGRLLIVIGVGWAASVRSALDYCIALLRLLEDAPTAHGAPYHTLVYWLTEGVQCTPSHLRGCQQVNTSVGLLDCWSGCSSRLRVGLQFTTGPARPWLA